MGLSRYMVIVWALIPVLAGCATTNPGVVTAPAADTQPPQTKITELEAKLKQQQDENMLLRQQLSKGNAEKKDVRMPSGKEVQLALKKAGYYKGDIDGQIGSKTKDAIKKFQAASGLNPDGVIGSRTWQLLAKYSE